MKHVLYLLVICSLLSFSQDKKKAVKEAKNDSVQVISTISIIDNLNNQIVKKQEELKTATENAKKLEQEILYLAGQKDVLNMLKKDNDSLSIRIK